MNRVFSMDKKQQEWIYQIINLPIVLKNAPEGWSRVQKLECHFGNTYTFIDATPIIKVLACAVFLASLIIILNSLLTSLPYQELQIAILLKCFMISGLSKSQNGSKSYVFVTCSDNNCFTHFGLHEASISGFGSTASSSSSSSASSSFSSSSSSAGASSCSSGAASSCGASSAFSTSSWGASWGCSSASAALSWGQRLNQKN